MTWVSVLAVFIVAHMVGDYLFQTDWQARNKRGGLSGGVAFRALAAHIATYTLAFVPALIWIGGELDAGWALLTGALIALPHLVIDDGRVGLLRLTEEGERRLSRAFTGIAAERQQLLASLVHLQGRE